MKLKELLTKRFGENVSYPNDQFRKLELGPLKEELLKCDKDEQNEILVDEIDEIDEYVEFDEDAKLIGEKYKGYWCIEPDEYVHQFNNTQYLIRNNSYELKSGTKVQVKYSLDKIDLKIDDKVIDNVEDDFKYEVLQNIYIDINESAKTKDISEPISTSISDIKVVIGGFKKKFYLNKRYDKDSKEYQDTLTKIVKELFKKYPGLMNSITNNVSNSINSSNEIEKCKKLL
jgi:hypothetical protein